MAKCELTTIRKRAQKKEIEVNPKDETMVLEITDDPTAIRAILEDIIKQLRGPDGKPKSREQSLAVTKLQEARYWLGEDMFGFKAP